jgi:hypothetical protein
MLSSAFGLFCFFLWWGRDFYDSVLAGHGKKQGYGARGGADRQAERHIFVLRSDEFLTRDHACASKMITYLGVMPQLASAPESSSGTSPGFGLGKSLCKYCVLGRRACKVSIRLTE